MQGLLNGQPYFRCSEDEIGPERNVKQVKHILEDEIKCLGIVASLSFVPSYHRLGFGF
jgi:hypothetical protein